MNCTFASCVHVKKVIEDTLAIKFEGFRCNSVQATPHKKIFSDQFWHALSAPNINYVKLILKEVYYVQLIW